MNHRVNVCVNMCIVTAYLIYVNMCRYLSRWIPGDEIVGSGGPPFLFPTSSRNQLGGVDGVNVGTSTSNIGFNNSSVQLSGMFASYVV